MEKARLIIRETKKKKIVAELRLSNDKTMPFPQYKAKDTSMDGTEVDVERIGGKIVKVQAGEQLLYVALASKPPSRAQSSTGHNGRNSHVTRAHSGPMQTRQTEDIRHPARAPYNFVPLNDTVVTLDTPIPDFDVYHTDRKTGWIDLKIETKTPVYIRDTATEAEDRADRQSSEFFSPGGKLRIPGSSLRGMLRTLVEIISFGKFGAFDDKKRLYFRGMADKSNLRKEYQEQMSSYDRRQRRAIYKMSAGILRKKGRFEYEIIPSTFRSIFKKEARENVQHAGGHYELFHFYKLSKGYLVVSGDMQKKSRDWLIDFPNPTASPIPILEDDIWNYQNDSTRAENVPNLISLTDQHNEVPCFYTILPDGHVSFGHTAMFRLAYQKTLGEHLPTQLHTDRWEITEERLKWIQNSGVPETSTKQLGNWQIKIFSGPLGLEKLEDQLKSILASTDNPSHYKRLILKHLKVCDFAEAIFGNETIFAGRVFMEDAFLDKGQIEVLMEEETPKILSTPKPTTFQHYLTQTSDNIRQLNHYNSNTAIRGHKLYWHQSGKNWRETNQQQIEKHKTQYTEIQPVRPGTIFMGRIRFENLSNQELGALLCALELPEGCYHKIGMGKPLGLGSIKITPRLFLSNRPQRYASFFTELNDSNQNATPGKEYKNQFKGYILGKLSAQETGPSLWETPRLTELRTMLDFEHGNALEKQDKIRYMEIERKIGANKVNEFKERPVLPLPSHVETGR